VNPDDSRTNILIHASDFCLPLSYHDCEAYGDATLATYGGGGTAYYWDVALNSKARPNPRRDPRLWLGAPYSPWPPAGYGDRSVFVPALRVVAHEISHALGIDYDEASGNSSSDPHPDMSSRDNTYAPLPITRLSADDTKRVRDHYGLGPAPTTLTGRVLWDEHPVPDATIELKDPGNYYTTPVLASATTDAEGHFALVGAPAGNKFVYAVSPNDEYWAWAGQSVTVPSTEH
jgi:hypothetical protein